MNDNYSFVSSYNCHGVFFFRSQYFLLDHFSEDILRELQAMEMSRCPLNQLKEQSSEKEQ